MGQTVKKVAEKIHEVIYKPYSEDILGYCIRITEKALIILNSALPELESVKAYNKLTELSASYPSKQFILLQASGQVHMKDALQLPYSRDDAE